MNRTAGQPLISGTVCCAAFSLLALGAALLLVLSMASCSARPSNISLQSSRLPLLSLASEDSTESSLPRTVGALEAAGLLLLASGLGLAVLSVALPSMRISPLVGIAGAAGGMVLLFLADITHSFHTYLLWGVAAVAVLCLAGVVMLVRTAARDAYNDARAKKASEVERG